MACAIDHAITSRFSLSFLVLHCLPRIILLRAPAIFKVIWSIAKHFFDPHIQDMIVFSSHKDYLEVVQEYVGLENLPPCLSEKGKAKAMPGYFEMVSLKGGPLVKPDESLDKTDDSATTVSSSSCIEDDPCESTRVEPTGKRLLQGVWDEKGSIASWRIPQVM